MNIQFPVKRITLLFVVQIVYTFIESSVWTLYRQCVSIKDKSPIFQ